MAAITRINTWRYHLPLIQPLRLKTSVIDFREGLIIGLRDDDGHSGFGEIAPLPGFSAESLPQAEAQWHDIQNQILSHPLRPVSTTPNDLPLIAHPADDLLSRHFEATPPHLFPSVRCGLEMALLHLLANQHDCPLYRYLSPSATPTVPVNALLTGSPDEMRYRATQLAAGPYRAVKLKVGRWPVAIEIELVNDIRRILPASIELRLDANRAWDFDTACQFAKGIRASIIAYIEEPLCDPCQLPDFYQQTGLSLALDETLCEQNVEQASCLFAPGVKAIILKPTLLGGMQRAIHLAQQAQRQGITPVVSSAFESGLGLRQLAHLAAAICPEGTAVGLDTGAWLAEDVLSPPFRIHNGLIDLTQWPRP